MRGHLVCYWWIYSYGMLYGVRQKHWWRGTRLCELEYKNKALLVSQAAVRIVRAAAFFILDYLLCRVCTFST